MFNYKGIDLEKSTKIKDQNRYLHLLHEDGFISRRHYEDYDNQSKSHDFRYSIELFNKLLEEEKYSVAIPIICSMIDDRENRLLFYIIQREKEYLESSQNLDQITYLQLSMLSWKVKLNLMIQFVGKEFSEEHFRLKMLRAESIHLLVYNLKFESSKELCNLYFNHFRLLDQHVQKLKRGTK